MLNPTPPALPAHPALSLVTPAAVLSLAAALDLPRRTTIGTETYLWSGPGSWLILSTNPHAEARLRAAYPGAKITAQGDGRALLRLTLPAVLPKLVPIDLHDFPEDGTALTHAAHIPVQIWREGDAFILACFRSYAVALAEAIIAASK
jgi:sarcosine oxidase subunit gamma